MRGRVLIGCLVCCLVAAVGGVSALAANVSASGSTSAGLATERAFVEARRREAQTGVVTPEVDHRHKASGAGHATAPAGTMSSQAAPEPEGSPVAATGGPAGALISPLSPLVAPGVAQAPTSGQQPGGSPVEAAARSRRLMGLNAAQVAQVDREVFPSQVERPAGGLASLPAGQRLVRLISTHAAQVEVPRGSGRPVRAAVESMAPLAVESSSGGRLEPVELALKKVGGVFESARPAVGVLLPQHASEGVKVPEAGVSLTPVDAAGVPLGGAEGQVDGASVIYANTQTNEDTLAKPTSVGFSLDAILRSSGPQQLYYRVGLPVGARLLEGHGSTPVRIVSGGVTIGLLTPPMAVDAAGRPVPVTMSVLDGDILSINVQQIAGEVPPVSVDPEYVTGEDRSLSGAVWPIEPYKGGDCENSEIKKCATNWKPIYTGAFSEAGTYKASYSCGTEDYWCSQSLEIQPNSGYNGGEYAGLEYKTQGESTVYNLEMWVTGYNEPSETDTEVEYTYCLVATEDPCQKGEGRDKYVLLSGGKEQKEYKYEPLSMTSGYFHNPLETPRHNDVRLMDYTTKHESLYGFWTWIWAARVYVAQEESEHPDAEPTTACPECGFNTTSPTIAAAANRTNVLYGSGGWLGPVSGAFEVTAHDPGIGISFAAVSGGGIAEERFIRNQEGKCLGIQCAETYSAPMTYLPTMDEGEDSMELVAEDAAGLYGYTYRTIKVDAKPPEKLEVNGWNARREISAAPHTLTVSATDEGPSGKKSSGVKSVAVSIDGGQETTIASAACPEGPCTASGSYTLHAEDLSEGVHRLVVMAIDNAGNVAPGKEYTFDVRHASPVAAGPGSVDPTTGQFTLNATDVSLGGVAGVARTYQSRNLTAGSNGPLGPQWALNLGVSQSLVSLPDGEVALTATDGGRTTFAPKGKGEYESPLGDENIKLEGKEKEAGKGISEYRLKDAKAGTTTVFTQPVGTEDTAPIYANQFGQQGAEMGMPVSTAIDANGNVWVTDLTNDRILEFSAAGVLLHAYGSQGEWLGNFKEPWGIGINRATGNVYVSDLGNDRIVELSASGAFVRTFGWGVKAGGERREEFQDCTSYCQAGFLGAGAGEIDGAGGVTVDASGDVWVAEYNSDRIQEFSADGEYLHSYGSAGSGDGQFEGPVSIVASGSDLYVTDRYNERVDELTSAGVFVKAIGWGVSNGEEKLEVCTSGCRAGMAGSGNGEFNWPEAITADASGNLYVSEVGNKRVQELTAAGAFVTKFGSEGSGSGQFLLAAGIAVNGTDEIYVADAVNKRVQEWMRPTWLPARTEDALQHVVSAYAYKPVQEEGSTVIEPTEVLAATPSGITCVGEHGEVELQFLKDGCRALSFNHAETTTAKGEAPAEWGDYVGHLTRVYFHGYDPASKAMKTSQVAHYLYDSKGRLRAEWDSRTEPTPESEECVGAPLGKGCLVTTYGYDEEGHVTSVTPPHREGWALSYGTIAGDGSGGRLLKVRRAPASVKLWGGEAVAEKEAPKLSGTPVLGVRMAVSQGQWSGEPVSWAFQWQDCNAAGGECSPIDGATNANYTPRSSDVGHTLAARVTVTNGAGSVTVATSASAVVASSWQEHSASRTQLVDGASSINAVSCQAGSTTCVISDANGNAFYASNVSASGAASWKAWGGPGEGPSEAMDCPSSGLCLMAAGKHSGYGGNLYYATSLGGSWTQAYSPSFGVDAISCVSASFCMDGQDGWGYFRYSASPASSSWSLEEQGATEAVAMKGVSCVSVAFCAIVDSAGSVHVATSEAQVKSSSWTETNIDGSTALNGIACMSASSCVAVDAAGDVLSLTVAGNGAVTVAKQNVDGSNALSGVSCAGGSTCVTVDTVGNVLVSGDGGGTWKKAYAPGGDLTSVSCASSSLCVAASSAGDVVSFDPALTQAVDGVSGLNAVSCIPSSTTCVVSDAKGGAYYATNVSATAPATWQAWSGPGVGPSEALDCPSSGVCLMAAGEHEGYGGNMYYATSLGGSWTQAYSPLYGVDAISCVSAAFCADGQDGGGYFRYATSPASSLWELESQGSAAMKGIACLSVSFCAMVDSAGNVHVATSEAQVKSSAWKQTSIDGSTPLNGVACTSTSSCIAVDDAGNLLNLSIAAEGAATVSKQNIDGSASLTAVACAGSSTCVAVDAQGRVFISTDGGKTWEDRYQLKDDLTSVSCASASLCAAADTSGQLSAFDPSSGNAGSSYTQPVDAGSTLNAVSCVPGSTDCVISDANGNAFYATNVSTSGTPSWKVWGGPGEGPSDALACPATSLCLMATGKSAYGGAPVYYAAGMGGEWKTAYTKSYGVESLSCASATFCVAGNIDGVFGWSEAPTSSWSTKHQEPYVVGNNIKAVSCLSSAFCAMASAEGYVYTAVSTAQVESESWIKTDADGSTAINGIACPSTHECVAVDSKGNLLNLAIAANGAVTVAKRDIDGTNSLNAISCVGNTCAAVDGKGNVFTSTDGGQVGIDQYTPGGDLTGVSCASASLCVAISKEGETTAFNAAGIASEASEQAPQPGTTIEYRVPVSGEGAPQNLSKAEVEKWGQKDDPQEATALFPPDEPHGWPAAAYKKATIDYMDEQGRTVNTRTPGGGVATTEYNEANEATRTLSPDNRVTALAAGAKSAEVAEHLSAITEYNPFDNQVVKVLGPEHKIKLKDGEEVQARALTHNYYNEGAEPAEEKNEEEYNLITKSVSAALLSNGEEKEKRTTLTSYNGQEDLGWTLRKPTSTTVDPEGLDLTSTTRYDATTGEVIETRTPGANNEAGAVQKAFTAFGGEGAGAGQLEKPSAVATDASGDVWVADTGHDRVQEFNSKGEFVREFGAVGTEHGEFKEPRGVAVSAAGDVYVADDGNDRVQEFNGKGEFVRAFGSEGSGEGQFVGLRGVAVDGEGHVWTVQTGGLAFEKNEVVEVAPSVQEFTAEGGFIRRFGAKGGESGQFKEPKGIAVDGKGDVWVADTGDSRVQEFKATGEFVRAFGSAGTGDGQFKTPVGLAFDGEGDVWVADSGNDRLQRFSPEGGYLSQVGTVGNNNGQFQNPEGVAASSTGDIAIADTANNRAQEFLPEHRFAHDAKTVYYSPAGEARVETCRNHPEWAGLPCRTEPAAQPADAGKGAPYLPVSTVTYNIWDEAETTTEAFGSVTRTKSQTYDAAGRALTSQETSTSSDTPLPTVTNEYNSETGALERQSATIKEHLRTTVAKDNALGQLVEYQDGSGNVARYAYEEGGDGRLLETREGDGVEAESKQSYSYSAETGLMSKLVDSAAGTFEAGYDLEGKMTGEIYPNGMCANTSYNSTGTATSISYIKTRNCAEEHPAVWFSDSITPGIYGETLVQESTLASERYSYDALGRLSEAQETPVGKGCAVRLYGYDEESNRLSQTSREPAAEGKCASAGGSVQSHVYDEANRLSDQGVQYEELGNTTVLPAADAEGHEIKSSYYLDGQAARQEQNGVADSYLYDPAGRTMEMTSENLETKAASTTISHYAGPSEAVTWITQGAEKWSRNIPGIGGGLQATEESDKVVTLQLRDLQGNIVATASVYESETKLLSTYNSTEFGVPSEGKTPPKYAWLGASGLATETAFGTGTSIQAGASYVPQVARNLQTAPVVPPGAFPNGLGGGQQYTSTISAAEMASSEAIAKQLFAEAEAARQAAKQREAEEAEEQAPAGEDPAVSISLGGKLTKWLARALAAGTPILSKLISKYGGAAGTLIAGALEAAGGLAVKGLNRCYEAYQAAGKTKEYSCKIVYDYWSLPEPPYVFPVELVFEDCYTYTRYKKRKESCIPTYTIGWKNVL